MNWLVKNILLIHIFALVLAFGWIEGGTRSDLLFPVVPWLTFFVLEWLLVFPQAKSTETLAEARVRVWRSLARDPLTYVALVLTALLIIPLFNVARPPAYDTTLRQWLNFKPPVTWLPFCVDAKEHAILLLWFPPVLIAALAARHGLLKKSKRWLLEGICWNGGALALLGFAQIYSGTDKLLWLTPLPGHFFSTFGYENFAGAFFTLSAAIALGLWFYDATENLRCTALNTSGASVDREWYGTHRLLLPAVLCFLGSFASLSRAAILLSVIIISTMGLYMLVYVWKHVTSGFRVTILASVFAIIVIVGTSFVFFKFDSFKAEVRSITLPAIVERVTGSGYYHVRVAKKIFNDHPVFGVGGWGYARYQLQYFTPEDKQHMQVVGGINVHNDTFQFLAEMGAVGYALILLCVVFLVAPLFGQVWTVCRAKSESETNGTATGIIGEWFYRVPIPLVAVSIGASATVCHSLGDLPFRDPAILIVWVLAWSCVPGWMPVLRKTQGDPLAR